VTLLDPAVTDFPRDQWGRPLIIPDGGGKPIPYTRASSAAKTVEDTYNLELWARRGHAYGFAHDASLIARVLAIGGNPATWDQTAKSAVDKIVVAAAAVAQAHKGADIGSAVHTLTERRDRGEQVEAGPYQPDLDAYTNALIAAGLTVVDIECRMVCDSLLMAGTADRIVKDSSGRHFIADIKTGATVDYGALGWAAQLAAYAHSRLYDIDTGTRLATPNLDKTTGYICHLPAGQGRCDLYEIDLVAGYRAAELANEIRNIRRDAKRWITPLAVTPPTIREMAQTRMAAEPEPAPPRHHPDEGGPVDEAEFEELRRSYVALPGGLDWLKQIVAEAKAAGVPIQATNNHTMRRYEIYRGLIRLAAHPQRDAIALGLVEEASGDEAVTFANVTLGHAIGSLDAAEAARFSKLADDYPST
jgi:hypothetical protein